MKVVILAGGYGTRISEESYLRPKPMIEIGGFPILWHIMKYYSHYGFSEFIICCGYKGYMIKEYFADYYLHRCDVTFNFSEGNSLTVHNSTAEPWKVTLVDTGQHTQTGGRIKRVRPYIGEETFMLTYGDGVSDVDLKALLTQHKRSDFMVTITGIQPGSRFGVLDIEGERVLAFREKNLEDGGWINGGFMVVEPGFFEYLEGDATVLERSPLNRLCGEENLGVYKHRGFWQCLDTQRDKNALEEIWAKGQAKWKLWAD